MPESPLPPATRPQKKLRPWRREDRLTAAHLDESRIAIEQLRTVVPAGRFVMPKPVRGGGAAIFVKVLLVKGLLLILQQVNFDGEPVGDPIIGYPWPGQAADDYDNKTEIVMRAERFDGRWVVLMTGDRVYTPWPAQTCDPCA
jgi:hypothetical protein